ncbi:MAG: tyrosine-protein phosphatase [Miniphocaeibacter sp.]|uniref:tyrosine-protein phosphatase n=1 Tax=Miniphocaeibacter sp. TaxID=3100973 RepID=UPI00185AFE2C|nr:tyrosine-protein phosphatase [Gallicola sp.]
MTLVERPVNLRDIGGYEGREGKTVKKMTLLRSGEITNITEKDKNILLNNYELRTIVDFRSENEKEEAPDTKINGVDYFHIDILKNNTNGATSLKTFKEEANPEAVNNLMNRTYEDFIVDSGAIAGYRQFIDLLLKQNNGSLVFHCFAGKDRTGFAAAIILNILGVSKENILYDYLLTNKMREKENNRIISKMKELGYKENELKAMDIALNVKEEYLISSINKANELYGSLDGYIENALKVDKEERKFLLEKYLI